VSNNIKDLLEHLCGVLDSDRRDEVETRHRRTLNWEPVDRLPVVMTLPQPRELGFTPYPHGEVFDNPEKMLFNELVYAFNTSVASRDVLGDDLPCTIRANFGTVVIASMFGGLVEQVEDNPPWVRRDRPSASSLADVLDRNPLDFSQGWCPRVVEVCQFYQDVLADYPELRPLIKVVLPDLQGPFDNLEIIVGSELFVELAVNEDIVSKALEAMATAQVGLAGCLAPYLSDGPDGFSHQHAVMIKGRILLRVDSVILMSPRMYRDIVAPHDQRVLQALGGGGVHTCGNAGMHAPEFLELPSIESLDLGQSEMNDIDALYTRLKAPKIPLTRLKVSRDDLASGRITDRFPTGISLVYEATSVRDAADTMDAYVRATNK